MFDLSGKVTLVVGGAGWLGVPICRGLAEQGSAVVIADLDGDRAIAAADEIRAEIPGADVEGLAMDAGVEDDILRTVAHVVERFGRIDVLVNGAYAAVGKRVEDLTGEEFDRANRVNLTGAFLLARAAADAMPPEGGSMILFTSMYGIVSPDPRIYHAPMNPNPIEYNVGKGGVCQMTRYLAVHYGPRNIRVNAIAPGPFPTTEIQKDQGFVERLADKVPLGRIGRREEMAGAVAFLASDEAAYVNGAILRVDGGWTAW